jgi:hypothetical protein
MQFDIIDVAVHAYGNAPVAFITSSSLLVLQSPSIIYQCGNRSHAEHFHNAACIGTDVAIATPKSTSDPPSDSATVSVGS